MGIFRAGLFVYRGVKPIFGALLLVLLPAAPVTLKRTPKVDTRVTYAMKALIDLGGKDDIRFTGTFNEKTKSLDDGKMTTAIESRVSVEVLGIVRQSAMMESQRVEGSDGSLLVAAKTDSTLLFAAPRIDRLRAFIFPAPPVEIGTAWWHLSEKDDNLKAPPNSGYFKLEGEEKVGDKETWRASIDAREVDIEYPTHVRGMVWLDKTDGSLVRGQWTIEGFVLNATTPPMNARLELLRVDLPTGSPAPPSRN